MLFRTKVITLLQIYFKFMLDVIVRISADNYTGMNE